MRFGEVALPRGTLLSPPPPSGAALPAAPVSTAAAPAPPLGAGAVPPPLFEPGRARPVRRPAVVVLRRRRGGRGPRDAAARRSRGRAPRLTAARRVLDSATAGRRRFAARLRAPRPRSGAARRRRHGRVGASRRPPRACHSSPGRAATRRGARAARHRWRTRHGRHGMRNSLAPPPRKLVRGVRPRVSGRAAQWAARGGWAATVWPSKTATGSRARAHGACGVLGQGEEQRGRRPAVLS